MPRGGGETVVVNNDGGGLRKKVFPPTPLHHTREGTQRSRKPPPLSLPFPARPEPKRARLKYLGMQVFCRAALPPSVRLPVRQVSFPPSISAQGEEEAEAEREGRNGKLGGVSLILPSRLVPPTPSPPQRIFLVCGGIKSAVKTAREIAREEEEEGGRRTEEERSGSQIWISSSPPS